MYWQSGLLLPVDESQLIRLMAISEVDFLRLLPRLLGSNLSNPPSNPLWIEKHQVTLQWRVLPGVRYGVITLPQLEVSLTFLQKEKAEGNFLQAFDRIYQRGGG